MIDSENLISIYREICDRKPLRIFVTPQIRFSHKRSDYLYLLYRDVIESDECKLTSISGIGQWRPLLSLIKGEKPVYHYHWFACRSYSELPSFLLKWIVLMIYSIAGGKLVWTIHNRMPPDTGFKRINFWVRKCVAKRAERIHIQCKAAVEPISQFYDTNPDKFRYLPHPPFPKTLVPRATAVESIRHRYSAKVKVQDRLFLMLGNISRYKRIAEVVQIFKELPVQKKLLVAGPVKRGQMETYKELKKLAASTKNVILIPKFISEKSLPEFMNAADCLVYNFTEEIASGGVMLGKSYRKSMILPDTECMREVESESMQFFSTPEELKELLMKY
ncbi:MAG: glycosyltransferase [Balneolaceae bacterium]|nr:glycosyltransferase [Balneolaceae bacterium]MCH8547586.1 glycosyltransferase [Balneolaceae bacterium]